MRRSVVSSLLLLCACEPVYVHLSGPSSPDLSGDGPRRDPVLVDALVETSSATRCSAPGRRAGLGPFERRTASNPSTSQAYLWSGGVLAGDLDEDGRIDIVAPSEPYARLYRGRAGGGVTAWDERLAGFDLEFGSGGSLADYDGDGDLDMLVLRWDRSNVLLRNEGGGHFTDVTPPELAAIAASTSSAWADVDRDGDLDLFVGSYDDLAGEGVIGGSYLYENRGTHFIDRSDRLPGELDVAYTRVAGFHDLDRDGYPDLYVVNDVGTVQGNLLIRNLGAFYFEVDREGVGLNLDMSGGGLGVGDVNGDGVLDLLIPQWDELSLMLSSDDGRWYDHAGALGLRADLEAGQRVGWGAELADFDNDGALDAAVAYGHLEVDLPSWSNPRRQPDALFLQLPDGTFSDVAGDWGVADEGTSRGFIVADLNEDGWLDLAKRDLDGPDLLYLSRCGEAHWSKIRLRDPTSANLLGIGARIKVITTEGEQIRTVLAGGTGFGSGGPPEVHFGLGAAEEIERLEVLWPDGSESWVHSVGVDRIVQVVRTE
ncbi:MAG TPA: CRTAC1 family protein [Deltaproteobacteria bacterium]|nr:CRTAC1 family protein [Deltaproteobacteria bacterium]